MEFKSPRSLLLERIAQPDSFVVHDDANEACFRYVINEATQVGPYTIHMWSVNDSTKGALLREHWKRADEIQSNMIYNNAKSDKDLCDHSYPNLIKSSDEIVLGSYLPQNTSGVRIPFFSSQLLPEEAREENSEKISKSKPTVPINIPFPKRMADFLSLSPVFLQDSSEYNPNIAASNQCQIALYLEGILIDPTEIPEFHHFSWAKDKSIPWVLRSFTRNEIDNILRDINSVSGFSDEISRYFKRTAGDTHSRDFLFVE